MSHPLWRWPAPLLVLLLAAALRLHQLGTQSLWSDEGNSVVQSLRSLDEIAQHSARDIHPPGYYWLLHGWRRLGGTSEFALRLFSALASVPGVAGLYALGRRLYGRTAGLAAALLLALNGFSIWYAQETRMYALLALWGVAAALALTALLSRPRRGRVLALALVNAAGLWTHYAWSFMLLAQGLVALLWLAGADLRRAAARSRLLAGLAAMGLALALFLPWLPTALERVTTWPTTGTPVAVGPALREIFGRLVLGPSHGSLTPGWQLLVAVAALTLVLAGSLPARRGAPLWRNLFPLIWTLTPLALFLALGLFREANLKFLLPAQAGFALWAGRGLGWLTARAPAVTRLPALTAAAILVTGMALTLGPLGHDVAWQRADYRALVADISVGLRADDLIILNAPNQQEVFHYYYRGAAPVLPLPPGTGPVEPAALQRLRALVAGARHIFALYWGEIERDPQRVVERALNELAFEAGRRWYGDVRLVRYRAPQALTLRREAGARFGEHIVLLRHARSAGRPEPGDWVPLQLDWRTDAPLPTRYKAFVQLLDAQGRLVAGHDGEPGGGLAPTLAWTPGVTVQDRRALILPETLPPGRYTLIAGLYTDGNPGQRLPVGDADHWVLETLEITGEGD